MNALRRSGMCVVRGLALVGLLAVLGGIAWWISPGMWAPKPPIGEDELFRLENRTEWRDPVYQHRPGEIVPESETANFFLRRHKTAFAGEQYSLVNPSSESVIELLKGEWGLTAIVGYSDDQARAETIAKSFRAKMLTHSIREDAVHGETPKRARHHNDLKVNDSDMVVTLERVLGPKNRIWIEVGSGDGQYRYDVLPLLCQRGWRFDEDSLSGAVPRKLLKILYNLRTSCADPARSGYEKPSVRDPLGKEIRVEVRFRKPVK